MQLTWQATSEVAEMDMIGLYSRRSLSRTSLDSIVKFELSVVRDNQSVTSCVHVLGRRQFADNVLRRHMYEYSEVKTLFVSCC